MPLVWGMTVAPTGTSAWRRLFSGMARRLDANISRMRPATSSSGSRPTPMTSAIASRVMSSWVGPRPPQTMTASDRSRAWRRAATIRAWLSPTLT